MNKTLGILTATTLTTAVANAMIITIDSSLQFYKQDYTATTTANNQINGVNLYTNPIKTRLTTSLSFDTDKVVNSASIDQNRYSALATQGTLNLKLSDANGNLWQKQVKGDFILEFSRYAYPALPAYDQFSYTYANPDSAASDFTGLRQEIYFAPHTLPVSNGQGNSQSLSGLMAMIKNPALSNGTFIFSREGQSGPDSAGYIFSDATANGTQVVPAPFSGALILPLAAAGLLRRRAIDTH